MKKFISILFLLISFSFSFAQIPHTIKYQGVHTGNRILKGVFDSSQYMSRTAAMELFQELYFSESPYKDQAVAFLYNKTEGDSLLKPGDRVSSFGDEFVYEVNDYSYFFWVDNEPGAEWLHSSSFVFMNALTGVISAYNAQSWPYLNNEELTGFNDSGNASPNLFLGMYPLFLASFNYNFTSTQNDSDWAIIVVGRNHDGRREHDARQNDVNRIKELLNGTDNGPRIDSTNIIVNTGTNGNGITPQELSAAFDSVAARAARTGRPCRKLYFFYIGHGSVNHMLLKDPNRNRDDPVDYDSLALKLLNTRIPLVCVSIEACYSGSAIGKLQKARVIRDGHQVGLNGVIVTSSPGNKKTSRGADGAPFNIGLDECTKDDRADLNHDGKVSLVEAVAWAKFNNNTVRKDNPQAGLLGNGASIRFGNPHPAHGSIGLSGATLQWEYNSVYYSIRRGKNDSIIVRNYLYFRNPVNAPHHPIFDIDIYCVNEHGTETHLMTFHPNLGPREKRCILNIPDSCRFVRFRRGLRTHKLGKSRYAVLQDAEQKTISRPDFAVYNPGEFLFQPMLFSTEKDIEYKSDYIATSNWPVTVSPQQFTGSEYMPQDMITLVGNVPGNATEGADFFTNVVNQNSQDTTHYFFQALLLNPVTNPIAGGESHQFKLLESGGGIVIDNGTTTIDNSIVRLEASEFVTVGTNGTLNMNGTTIGSDDSVGYGVNISGTVNWHYCSILETEQGTNFDGAKGYIENLYIVGSQDDGVKFYNDMNQLKINFLDVDQSAVNGLYFDAAVNDTIRNASISHSMEKDVSLNNGSNVVLIDCNYDKTKESVDETSKLTRSWTTDFSVTAQNGDPLKGAIVSVSDNAGNIEILGQTDSSGYLAYGLLTEYVTENQTQTEHTPHTVRVKFGDKDSTFLYEARARNIVEVRFDDIASKVEDKTPTLPDHFALLQNYPNPFNPTTTIIFDLPKQSHVTLKIYNILGQEVQTLINETKKPGSYQLNFNADSFASGVYIYRIQAGDFTSTKKMMLIK